MPSEESPSSGAAEIRPRRLQPDQPAAGGRDADRAAAVVAVGDREHAAATAAAAPPEEPPGVRSRSHGLRVGPKMRASLTRQDAVLGQRRRADDHEAGVAAGGA